jgi:hypothetical protein
MQTVSKMLGIPIDHYVLIDFNGFEELVDAVGGITIDVPETFTTAGGVLFEAGPQTMDGETALAYARDRSGPEGDFGRIERQQQIIRALVARSTGLDIVTSIGDLLPAVEANVRTDLAVTDMVSIGSTYRTICAEEAVTLLRLEGELATFDDPLIQAPLSYVVVDEAEIRRKVAPCWSRRGADVAARDDVYRAAIRRGATIVVTARGFRSPRPPRRGARRRRRATPGPAPPGGGRRRAARGPRRADPHRPRRRRGRRSASPCSRRWAAYQPGHPLVVDAVEDGRLEHAVGGAGLRHQRVIAVVWVSVSIAGLLPIVLRRVVLRVQGGEEVVEGLRQRRVREDAVAQGGVGQPAHHRDLEHRHDLAALEPEDRRPEDLPWSRRRRPPSSRRAARRPPRARATDAIGIVATSTASPRPRASASVRPIRPSWGSV